MKTLFVTFAIFFSLMGDGSAQTNKLPSCNVNSLRDAQLCMDKVARLHVEYNQPNIGSASNNKASLMKVMKALGLGSSKTNVLLQKAAFVGVMLEKGDEWYLYYYVMNLGQTKPFILGNINLVDLTDITFQNKSEVSLSDLLLGDKFKKFDADDRRWLQEYLELE